MGHTISTFQYNIAIQLRCFCELITTIMLNMVYNIFFSLSSLPLKYVLQYAQYQYLIWWGIVLSARTRSEDVNYEIMMTRSSFMMFRKARQRQNLFCSSGSQRSRHDTVVYTQQEWMLGAETTRISLVFALTVFVSIHKGHAIAHSHSSIHGDMNLSWKQIIFTFITNIVQWRSNACIMYSMHEHWWCFSSKAINRIT